MTTARDTIIHIISTLLLMLWGGIMLYFYASERIINYLPPDGIFRPMVLWSAIGMIVLGLFNLITLRSKEADCGHDHSAEDGCCGHDHHDHTHSHSHNHGNHHHDHAHKEGESCCDHGHDHEYHHDHDHTHAHGHDHHGCCGHDHDHHHGHEDEHAGHVHAHGILHESGALGRGFAIFMLAVPITYAAVMTPDAFSAHAVMNKGVYNQNYASTTRADQFSLKNKTAAPRQQTPAVESSPPAVVQAPQTPEVHDQLPGMDAIPVPTPDKVPDTQAQDAKSMGNFTLADLEQQIPKSQDGNFMLEVPEIYYTAGDKEVQGVLTGQPIETVAQVLPEKGEFNPGGNRVRIFRMMVQCCAADARPYSIPVQFNGQPPAFKDMSWIKVTGKMSYEKQGEQVVPLILADSLSEAAEPVDKMVY